MPLTCQYCETAYNHKTDNGHWEEVDIGTGETEIWYCCHNCRDEEEPCETFFPLSVLDDD